MMLTMKKKGLDSPSLQTVYFVGPRNDNGGVNLRMYALYETDDTVYLHNVIWTRSYVLCWLVEF